MQVSASRKENDVPFLSTPRGTDAIVVVRTSACMAETIDQQPCPSSPVGTTWSVLLRRGGETVPEKPSRSPCSNSRTACAACSRRSRAWRRGTADRHFRMAWRPAATLLHLGPGFANGMANLHNVKKAMEQARIDTRRIATLIAPADAAWSAGRQPVRAAAAPPPSGVQGAALILTAASVLRDGSATLLLLGGSAAAIAQATGCALRTPISSPSNGRCAGRVEIQRVPNAARKRSRRCATTARSCGAAPAARSPTSPSLTAPTC